MSRVGQVNMTQNTRKQIAVAVGLTAVTLAVFWPVRGFDFINYDDNEYFSANRHVLGGLTRDNLFWAFQLGTFRFWHPLTWLSLMLDVTCFGPGPGGPHLTNLILHTTNVVLLFVVLRRLTGAHWRSAVVAGLFALHPLRVESVAWVAERKDMLSTCFWMLTLLAYTRYAQSVTGDACRMTRANSASSPVIRLPAEALAKAGDSSRYYLLALFFFACGLMSKPMLVTLPFALLLLDYWPLQRWPGTAGGWRSTKSGVNLLRLAGEKIPFFGLSLIFGVLTFVLHRHDGSLTTLADFPMGLRIENAFVSVARYLGKIFWPVALALPYPHPRQWPWLPAMLAVVLVAGLCLAAVWLGRRRPYVLVGWFWFVGTLLPVIGLAQAGYQAMADRFTYVPLIGLFLVGVWGAGEMLARGRLKWLPAAMAILVLGACAFRTRDQLHYWQNSESLFRHTMAMTKNNDVAYNNLGTALMGQNRLEEAMGNFRQALQIRPDYPEANNNLGIILVTKDNPGEAVRYFQEALRTRPDYADARLNLGVALVSLGRPDEAMQQYLEVLRWSPDDVEARCNLGIALMRLGRRDEAIEQFKAVLRLRPDHVVTKQKLLELGVPNLE
jgi:protein O-mannosyl-transferase